MNSFAIASPATFAEAATLATDRRFRLPVIKAGGMDVLDHLKEGLIDPDLLINVRPLRLMAAQHRIYRQPEAQDDGLLIEANATLTEVAESAVISEMAPVLAQAVSSAATPQVRNVASVAGNLLQRPRCWYYRNHQFDCLKKGGGRCYAIDGVNRFHAIFGGGPCHIVHPSNLAPALYVTNGQIHLTGSRRESLPITDLYHLPARDALSEHTLDAGEVVTHITAESAPHSGFYAIKEKQSFDWPLVFACVALRMDGDVIRSARICAGAVAPVPWPLPHVAEALVGINVDNDAALRGACELATRGATPMTQNAFKVRLLPIAVQRAVLRAAGRPVAGLDEAEV